MSSLLTSASALAPGALVVVLAVVAPAFFTALVKLVVAVMALRKAAPEDRPKILRELQGVFKALQPFGTSRKGGQTTQQEQIASEPAAPEPAKADNNSP